MRSCFGLICLLLIAAAAGCESGSKPAASNEKNAAAAASPATKSAAGDEAHFAKAITEASFETDVVQSDKVVLLDCWAPWCGPCLKIAPVVEEIAKEFDGQAVVAKLDVDTAPGIAGKFQIDAIPALLFFKDGKVVDKIIGVESKEQIVAKLKSVMGK